MTTRQNFGDFLNSAGPSTPRGRGGSRGGRGGRGRGGGGGKADYSNVPLDYDKLNKQGYSRMDGFTVAPYGPATNSPGYPSGSNTPNRGRGSWTPRARGSFTPGSQRPQHHLPADSPSGSATPVRGLGYRGRGIGAASTPVRGGLGSQPGGHRGKGKENQGMFWGGRGAPLFVKAGELFKEGEVDVVTIDQDDHVHIEAMPLSDPSAPQMTNLHDETEIEVFDFNDFTRLALHPQQQNVYPAQPVIQAPKIEEPSPPAILDESPPMVVEDDTVEPQSPIDEAPLFFIDTEPDIAAPEPTTTYKSMRVKPLGTLHSDDEKIVFVPKTYRQPEPISIPAILNVPARAPPAVITTLNTHFQGVYMDPRAALSRKDKKKAKREKRKGNKKKGGNGGRGMPRDDSDMEWGSDGPPPAILDIEGVGEDDEGDDVAILRDYLAGTLLNAKSEMEEMEEERAAIEAGEEMDVEEVTVDDGGDLEDVEGDWESSSGSQLTEEGVTAETKGKTSKGHTKGKGRAKLDPAEFYDPEGYVRKSKEGSDVSGDSEDDSSIGDVERTIEEMFNDSDSSEEDDFFNGKDTWADETEWFIRDMEDALDGEVSLKDRKQRNKLFRAIETGDFGDDWPTAPVKKGKKNKHVPAELQDVWERDRQKKAEKKRQRELERLVAEIEAHTSVRKKGRGKKNIPPVSQAHLLPGSAAEVAAMFDVSSEEEFLRSIEGPRRSKKGMALLPKTMDQINEEILDFLDDAGRSTLSLPAMDKEARKKVHLLADCYGLKSQSKGSGKNRFPVLIRLPRSGKNVDQRKVNRIIAASTSVGGGFYKAMYTKSSEKKKGPRGDPGSSVRHKDGDQVGEGAERIGMDNIGHRLLSKMGWSEGDRIGKSGGLEAPIIAIVKNTKSGLGA